MEAQRRNFEHSFLFPQPEERVRIRKVENVQNEPERSKRRAQIRPNPDSEIRALEFYFDNFEYMRHYISLFDTSQYSQIFYYPC